jgi:hypothetical protein
MAASEVERHLSLAGLNTYLADPARSTVPIAGSPAAVLQIDPHLDQIAVDIAWAGGPIVALEKYQHLHASSVHHDGKPWVRIAARGREVISDAYPVLCAMVDNVQLTDLPVEQAVQDVLARYHVLLQTIGRLTPEGETGLFGELLVLHHLIASVGAAHALASWVGPAGGEHDFVLQKEDIEVKTTTSEQRRHWIGGLTQLVATGSRALWLLSIQVTSAGDSADGLTLPDLEDKVRAQLPQGARAEFGQRVVDVGYDIASANLYTRRFTLRTLPRALLVDEDFPRLTPQMLQRAKVATERLPEVNYVVDLTGMEGEYLAPMAGFTFPGEPDA